MPKHSRQKGEAKSPEKPQASAGKDEFPPLVVPEPGVLWHRPPRANKGDSDADALYRLVGVTASAWEEVESSFADLFTLLMRAASFLAAKRVFGTLMSASVRTDALDAAAHVAFAEHETSSGDRQTYKRLTDHYRQAAARRNDIIHAKVIRMARIQPDNAEEDLGFFVVPPTHSTKKNVLPGQYLGDHDLDMFGMIYRYTSADIDEFVRKFNELTLWTIMFTMEYRERYLVRR